MDTFLPPNYKEPVPQSNYMKLQDGENTFRVLSSAIVGWLDWATDAEGNRKPLRFRMDNKPQPFDPAQPLKHFWAFVVYNYDAKRIQILEVTQATIREGMKALVDNPKWGDPKDFDVTITKSGEKLDTTYTVMPNPKTELEGEVKDLWAQTTVDLAQLYEGGDPFAGAEVTQDDMPAF